MDDTMRVVFLNLSIENDKFSEERKNVLAHLKKQPNTADSGIKCITLQETSSIEDTQNYLRDNLAEIVVLIVWSDYEHTNEWNKLDDFMEEEEETYYVGFIVISGFKQKDVFRDVKKALLRKVYTLERPVNLFVLKAFVEALYLDLKDKRSLDEFKDELLACRSLHDLTSKALQFLKNHSLIGYDRATISLVDRKSKTGKRYLLKLDDSKEMSHRLQKLQKDIQGDKAFFASLCKWYLSKVIEQLIQDESFHREINKVLRRVAGDKLIQKVDKKIVCIIEDLEKLRAEPTQTTLSDWGWTDEDTTKDIKSWIGLAAKRQNRTVAIITLDRKAVGRKYDSYNHKLKTLLRDFGEIFATAIEDFNLERNRRIVKEVTNEMGDDLTNKNLIKQMLVKLSSELRCERGNCTYFSISYDLQENEYFLSEFTSAKDELCVANKSKKQMESEGKNGHHLFKKGHGIVGAVLQEGKSRLVPHAFEDDRFIPTLKHPGDNVSMLAVPIIPIFDKHSNKPNRIVGVISCYVEELDYFTIYDRDLVEDIACSIATIIERTMTLEFLNGISSQMPKFVVDSDITNVLKSICQYALKMTSAGSASIHLLQYVGNNLHNEFSNDSDEKVDNSSCRLPLSQWLRKFQGLDFQDSKNYRATGDYYTFPSDTEASPRLQGKGTTSIAIRMNKTVEFSVKNGKLHLISGQKHPGIQTVVPFASKQKNRGVKYKIVIPLKAGEGKQEFIGALYLNKYSNEAFSEIEKFALELFAKQAAIIIKNQHIISENFFWSKAHENFKLAIETIACRDDVNLLLQDVAQYSYSLLKTDLNYLTNRNAERDPGGEKTEGHVPTLADLVSYVVISNQEGKREVKAAWPISELIDLRNKYCCEKKKGITGLAAEGEKTVKVNDIREDKENKPDRWREYIEFKKETLSQLAIPILYDEVNNGGNRVIGVINLEYSLPYAFKDIHEEVIKHFARQVAIAFQKKNLLDQINSNNRILTSLHRSLSNIMLESPQNILYKAVSQTREALEAKEVVVILYGDKIPEIIPPRDNGLMNVLLEPSRKVYDMEGDDCIVYTNRAVKNSESHSKRAKFEEIDFSNTDFSYGFCLPFSSGSSKMGVMWIIFSKDCYKESVERDHEVYKVYVNQIALAYENANRFEKFKKKENDDLIDEITKDSKALRIQALRLYWTSLFFSILSLLLIVGGVSYQAVKSDSRNALNAGGFVAIAGVILNAVTVLAFNREKEANDRVDQYHKEIYDVGKLRILLSAAEQLIDPETVKEEKKRIIQSTINPWLQSANKPSGAAKFNKTNESDKDG